MRSRPVETPHFTQYQATILLCVASAGLSWLAFGDHDLDYLVIDHRAWPREPWRLLTTTLLHGSVLHLVFNLYWTWTFGRVLEPILGSLAMVLLFVLLGAGSTAAQWTFSGPCIGLSGIGYGLFGLAWALDRYHPSYRGMLDPRTTGMFVLWFFFCIVATWAHWMPVANWAHGGGAVLGALVGISLSPFPRRRAPARAALAALVPLLALACTVGRPYLNRSDARALELFDRGLDALDRGDLEAAAEAFEGSARLGDDPAAWHNLGVTSSRLGRLVEAQEAFLREKKARERE